MIPKKIHYIWFGSNPKPSIFNKCLSSWEIHAKEYEIIFWNEDNFDIQQNAFCQNAYKQKQFQLLSDYARFKILYEEGGVYLDVDVELLKPVDDLLKLDFYMGWQNNKLSSLPNINSGLGFGSIKGHVFLKKMIDIYEHMSDDINDNYKYIPCPILETQAILQFGIIQKDRTQKFDKGVILSSKYFDPMGFFQEKKKITHQTYSIHHYSYSWADKTTSFYKKYKEWFNKKGE